MMELPGDTARRWDAAGIEIDRATRSWAHPGFSDELGELDNRVTSAHRAMADVYDHVATAPGLAPALAAAAVAAAAWHRHEALRCRRSPEDSHAA